MKIGFSLCFYSLSNLDDRKLSDEQVVELKRRREDGEMVKHLMADCGI